MICEVRTAKNGNGGARLLVVERHFARFLRSAPNASRDQHQIPRLLEEDKLNSRRSKSHNEQLDQGSKSFLLLFQVSERFRENAAIREKLDENERGKIKALL